MHNLNQSQTEPLHLRGLQPFAKGSGRFCFVHPHHRDRCVKVPRPGCEPETLHRQLPLWRRLRKPVLSYDENHTEWLVFSELQTLNDPSVWQHLPRCFGFCETDMGRGLVTELIRDADGAVSLSFLEYLSKHGYDRRAEEAFGELTQYWASHTIPSRNLGLRNLAAQVRQDGSLRLVLIDRLGTTEFLPLAKWIKPLAFKRSRRRVQILRKNLDDALQRRSRGETHAPDAGANGFLLSRE